MDEKTTPQRLVSVLAQLRDGELVFHTHEEVADIIDDLRAKLAASEARELAARLAGLGVQETVAKLFDQLAALRETAGASDEWCRCREIQAEDPRRHFKGCPLRKPLA